MRLSKRLVFACAFGIGAWVSLGFAQSTQEFLKLVADDGGADDLYGFAVAIDDGRRLMTTLE